MVNNEKTYTIGTSKDNCLKFYLNNDSLVLEELINDKEKNKTMLKEEVVDYSLYVDEKVRIHIIYLNNKKQLNYLLYPKYTKDINLLTIKEDLSRKPLDIKLFHSNIHIIIEISHKGAIHIKWKRWNNIWHKETEDVLYFKRNLESYIALEESKPLSIDPLERTNNKTAEAKESYIEDLLSEIKAKDKNIVHLKERISLLEKTANFYNNSKNNLEYPLHKLKEEIILIKEKCSQKLSQYEEKLLASKVEQDKLQLDTIIKFNSLLKILDEKNIIIENLLSLKSKK